MEPVTFEEADGGLWLSFSNYRSLERNIIALQEYAAKMRVVIQFYQQEQEGK